MAYRAQAVWQPLRYRPSVAGGRTFEGGPTISPYFTGSRGVFSRASAGHKRKSLVKIGEVTPPKRPSILGPLELGEPIDHSGTPPSPPVIYGAIFDPPSNSDPPLLPPLRVGNRGR